MLIDLWQEYDPQASGWITMTDLVFLLYQLPPPLGSKNLDIDFDSDDDKTEAKGSRTMQQERYLVNPEKGIIMKKMDALDLLKGLKIKVYPDSEKQIHFPDVVKALLKRVFTEKNYDFKLSHSLNTKMKKKWKNKHKKTTQQTRGKKTVREEQAAIIITKWARSWLNNQRN